jgi:DNA modification methylase
MLASHGKSIFDTLGRQPIHPFPARMAAGIALAALSSKKGNLRVLDPMMGSGTVLAVARSKGHYATGVDLDPLAVLMGRVWTSSVDREKTISKAEEVLRRARKIFGTLPVSDAYPIGSDEETKKFIRYWFDGYVRRQLAALSFSIKRVQNKGIRDILWCALSRLIITKSVGASLAMDLAHSRPHKTYTRAPAKPFQRFLRAVKTVVENCPERSGVGLGPRTAALRGDARALKLKDKTIDLVLTSPPYLNAIDYIRCSKFSLVWMGHQIGDLRKIRRESIGCESGDAESETQPSVKNVIRALRLTPALPSKYAKMLSQYIWDMSKSIAEVSRVLKRGGRAVYVVGDSTIRGTFVRNSSIVSAVAKQNGLKLVSRHSRKLPNNRRYLPPPRIIGSRDALDSRMRREVVLVFRRN